ncbi:hypothetical protein LZ30DRAFT_723409 [Colletotrichum cereale]|nr:hypothetical protein LZ30DRAFT_723409 [Colletotrichum cereale]
MNWFRVHGIYLFVQLALTAAGFAAFSSMPVGFDDRMLDSFGFSGDSPAAGFAAFKSASAGLLDRFDQARAAWGCFVVSSFAMSVQGLIYGVYYWLQQPSISWTEASRRRSRRHLLIVSIVFAMVFAGADVGFAASFGKVQGGASSTAACLVAVLAVVAGLASIGVDISNISHDKLDDEDFGLMEAHQRGESAYTDA